MIVTNVTDWFAARLFYWMDVIFRVFSSLLVAIRLRELISYRGSVLQFGPIVKDVVIGTRCMKA